MDRFHNPICETLTDLRKNKNYSQNQLADKLNERFKLDLVQSDISKLENGTKPLTTDLLIAYSKYFDVSTDYILGLNTPADAEAFYPSQDDITPFGIFKAINYLLVAYGEENIIDLVNVRYADSRSFGGFNETLVPTLKFHLQDTDDEDYPYIDCVGRYLNKIKSNENVKSVLSQVDEEEIYTTLLRKWANIDNCKYDKDAKLIYVPAEENIEKGPLGRAYLERKLPF